MCVVNTASKVFKKSSTVTMLAMKSSIFSLKYSQFLMRQKNQARVKKKQLNFCPRGHEKFRIRKAPLVKKSIHHNNLFYWTTFN